MSGQNSLFPTAVIDTIVGKIRKEAPNSDATMDPDFEDEKEEAAVNTEAVEENKEKSIEVHDEYKYEENLFDKGNESEKTNENEEVFEKEKVLSKDRPKSSIKPKDAQHRNMTFEMQQMMINPEIRNNPYVAKRLNIFPLKPVKPPRAAFSSAAEYREKREIVLDEYTNLVLQKKIPEEKPSVDQLKSSSHQLRLLERKFTDQHDYVEARKINNAFRTIKNMLKKATHEKNSKADIEVLISKRNELLALLDHMNDEFNKKIDEHNAIMSEKASEMIKQHQEELDLFDQNKPTELRPLFKKKSTAYNKIRSEEKQLALLHKFNSAMKKKAQADMLEKLEEQRNYEEMDNYYREKRMRILERQTKTVNNFSQFAGGRLMEIKSARAKAIDPLNARIASLNRLIEKMCEKREINPQQLNFNIIDNERVEILKVVEMEGKLPRRAVSSASSPPKSATIKKPVLTQPGKV